MFCLGKKKRNGILFFFFCRQEKIVIFLLEKEERFEFVYFFFIVFKVFQNVEYVISINSMEVKKDMNGNYILFCFFIKYGILKNDFLIYM